MDDIFDRLRGRADSSRRCLLAVRVLLENYTPRNRQRVERAYGEIPRHLKVFLLHDHDAKLGPLFDLLSDERERRRAGMAYFERWLGPLLDGREVLS